MSQPTVGRRLAALEASLGVRLLERTPDGYVLTVAGDDVHDRAERLEHEAQSLERTVSGRDTRLAGTVRVTCAEMMAGHVLAPCFAALQRQHSDIIVELIPDSRELSLAMREAELSVRLTQPIQHDLLVRRIGSLDFGLYASPEYLERHGDLDFGNGCEGHRLIAQLDDIQDAPHSQWLADLTPRAEIAFRTSSHEAAVSAAVHGAGLACLARFRADPQAGLIRLVPAQPAPTTGIWLVVHRDNRETSRIRAVMTHIADYVRSQRASLTPEDSAYADPHQDGSAHAANEQDARVDS